MQLLSGHSLPFQNGNNNLVAFSQNKQTNKLGDGSCRDVCIPVIGDHV